MQALLGKTVVLDSKNSFVYVGVLDAIEESFLVLRDADVHDLRDTPTLSREQYVQRCREHGVAVNRTRVWVNRGELASASALDDIAAC